MQRGESAAFPASELDSPESLLASLGGFWAEVYGGRDLSSAFVAAVGRLDAQAHADLLELRNAVSRREVQVLHRDEWYPLTLRGPERLPDSSRLYGGGRVYGDGLVYGDVSARRHAWKLPDGLRLVPCLCNRISAPSRTLISGVDYMIAGGEVSFLRDPFADELIPESEGEVGPEVTLWAHRSQWDRDAVYTQFGYAIGLRAKTSSEAYKRLVNAVYDALAFGPTVAAIEEAVAAVCDVPLAVGNEVVEAVLSDAKALWVVTDANAYRLHADSAASVSAGDTLSPGQTLSDALHFYDLSRVTPPSVRAFAVGAGLLSPGYYGELVFENAELPLSFTTPTAADPYTRATFPVGGLPGDVAAFWDYVHAAGVASGLTLAMRLAGRTAGQPQPGAESLPATANPMRFLLENAVGLPAPLLAEVEPSLFGPGALGMHRLSALRKVVPPHTAVFVFSRLDAGADEVIMGPDDYEEDAGTFDAVSASDEVDSELLVSEFVKSFAAPGRCV